MASPPQETPTLRTVCNELSEVEHKAYKIGIQLGIPHHKMQMFKKEEDMLSAVIDFWLSGNVEDVPATWESIVAALESKSVSETALAKTIATKFCYKEVVDHWGKDQDEGSSSPASPLSPSIQMDLEQQLELNLKIITRQYANYVDRILTIVQEKGITSDRLRTYLLNLSASTSTNSKLKLLSDMKTELKEAETVNDIFFFIGLKYASFLDYEIFEAVLERFGENEQHEDLNYSTYLKTYIEKHKIQEFVRLNPRLQEHLDNQSELIELKFSITKTQSLSSLKEVIAAVANILGIQTSALRLYDVQKGCVLVTLMIHTSIANAIFTTKLTEDQMKRLREASILWLKYRSLKFEFQKPDNYNSSLVAKIITTPPLTAVESTLTLIVAESTFTPSRTPTESTATPLPIVAEPATTATRHSIMPTYITASSPRGSFTLRTVCNELSEVRHKAYKIGIQLGIPHSKMQMFKKEDNTDTLPAVIDFWLSGNVDDVPATWEYLVEALESRQVGETGLANTIATRFCYKEVVVHSAQDMDEGSSESALPLSSDIEIDLKQQLNRNLKIIRKQYANYVDRIFTIVEEKGVTPDCLSTSLLSLSASTNANKNLKLLTDLKTELKEAKTVNEIFFLIGSKYASFIDHEIFEAILKQFGENEQHEDLNYPTYLKTYIKKHKIREFVTLNPQLQKHLNSQSELVELKLNITHNQRLSTLKEVIAAVANILEIKASALRLYDVKSGCVLVTLMLHTSIANAIFTTETKFTANQNERLREASVLWLKYKGLAFSFQKPDNINDNFAKSTTTAEFVTTPPLQSTTTLPLTVAESIATPHPTVAESVTTTARHSIMPIHIVASPSQGTPTVREVRNELSTVEQHKAYQIGIQLGIPHHKLQLLKKEDDMLSAVIHYWLTGNTNVPATWKSLVKALQSEHVEEAALAEAIAERHGAEVPKQGSAHVHGASSATQQQPSSLHDACIEGDLSLVRTLIYKQNADPNARGKDNLTPLQLAAIFGKDEVALALITEFHCDIEGKWSNGKSLLHAACAGGSVALVRALICDYNADPSAKDYANNTPLHSAANLGKDDAVLMLINEFGCNPNLKGWEGRTVLHMACDKGSAKLVCTLIKEHHADPIARDKDNSTPLHHAAKFGHEKLVLTMINKLNCDINLKGRHNETLLHCACFGGSASLVRALIREHGADPNARNGDNNTPLHEAALYGKEEVAIALINEFGCDTKEIGWSGRSLLHIACQGGSVNLVRTLILEHNAATEAMDEDGHTPLHVAALSGKEEAALALINEFGCDTTTRDKEGWSVLHCACYSGCVNLALTLTCDHNANLNDRNKDNKTPLELATRNGKQEVIKTLGGLM